MFNKKQVNPVRIKVDELNRVFLYYKDKVICCLASPSTKSYRQDVINLATMNESQINSFVNDKLVSHGVIVSKEVEVALGIIKNIKLQ